MKPLFSLAVALTVLSCSPSPSTAPATAPGEGENALADDGSESPRLTVSPDRKVLQTLVGNLDQDAAEEQILVLQSRANLSLPVTIQVADYDVARKTYYLAWEGKALASASQPFTLVLEDLVGDHQQEVVLQGLDESGHPSLDVFRLEPPTGSLGFAYKPVFSRVSQGTIHIETPIRPESYEQGQNSDLSALLVVDEPDSASHDRRATLRTTYSWLFQKGEYVATGVERYLQNESGDATLEKLYGGDNATLEAYLAGPWVRSVSDTSGLLILFLDPKSREITLASPRAQEVYRWEVSSRSSRSSLTLIGSNDLISLIKVQMGLSLTANDTLEVNVIDNPGWSGTYKRLDPTAALTLARQGTSSLPQESPPTGLYRNDKGDEFDFLVPEIRLKLKGVSHSGSVAVFPLGGVTVLQIKVPARPGFAGLSRAYSMVAKEETSTSRLVRTLRLQGGTLTSKGWVSDQSEPLRLEQVEGPVRSNP